MKIFFLLFCLPLFTNSQNIKYRNYKEGEITRYRLTTESNEGDKKTRTVSIAELKVVPDSGYYSEEITWLSKIKYSKDSVNMDDIAKKVTPYRISMDPKGSVKLPKLEIPEMIGEVTDLNTFFVAISPAFNIAKLSRTNAHISKPELVQGKFGDGNMILKGEDCLQVGITLISLDEKYSTIQTQFRPPSTSCLTPILDTIGKKTFEAPNNFQMIRKADGNLVNLFWGVETFTIITKIENKTGKIVEANMVNTLNLKMRYNCSPDLQKCAAEFPVVITRNLKLEPIQ